MNRSVHITTREGDQLIISVSTIDSILFPDDIKDVLGGIEIVEATLARVNGDNSLSFSSLMQVASVLGEILKSDENIMLYFYCDDMHNIKRRNLLLSPQQFRSQLFSRMYQRYIEQRNITDMINIPIRLKADHEIFIHFITKEQHVNVAYKLRNFISDIVVK